MTEIHFEWDKRKEKANIKKMAFLLMKHVRFFDPDHSDDEDRFILLGISFKLRNIVVCHCFRESDTVIRIISARK